MKTGILGVGSYLPPLVLTNKELEKTLDTSDEWIRKMTGITQRHIAKEETTSFMAIQAANEALAQAGLTGSQIDLIIVATATPDHAFPSVSCMIQQAIGATNAASMDLSAACTGFMYGMITAQNFIASGNHTYALVIGAEKLSSITNWDDRNTAVLFGDGAGAVVIGKVSDDRGILSYELGSDGSGGEHLYNDPHIIMNGREVFKFAVRQVPQSAENVLKKAGYTTEDVDFLIPHQANIRIIEAARERFQLPIEKVSTTVSLHGNTSAASIPLALKHELSQGKIKDDDLIILVGFGGGLTWGALCLKWGI